MYFELPTLIKTDDTYTAHCLIERLFHDLPQGEGLWRAALIRLGGKSLAIIRAKEPLSGHPGWLQKEPSVECVDLALFFTPKNRKPGHMLKWCCDADFAANMIAEKLSQYGDVSNMSVSELLRTQVNASSSRRFLVNHRKAQFSLKPHNAESMENLMLSGVGGCKAFGFGVPFVEQVK